MASHILVIFSFLAITCSMAAAGIEPGPLQDFCVADPNSSDCINPKLVKADNFFSGGLHVPGNTSNPSGSAVTSVSVAQIPGLNTLGITLLRFDFAKGGLVTPHTHPRASEIVTVLDGSILVGFVSSFPDNRLFSKVLQTGDVFVFPIGLTHFLSNVGNGTAAAIASLNSQNPGFIPIPSTVFGTNPPIADDVLAKAYQVDKLTIAKLQARFKR
ncbi:unnamed protein product [Dovyalis caffra]|uniref:Germin-like protein n=1 Tax=Dovyalis caffra TaxID=77055 RepID=A0AAV1SVZ5_9ROSI|nr:unnamed protein product [Dovyalis caffra]